MEKRVLSPHDFIVRAVNAHPSLYAAPTYDEVKFRILDHVLNTIGNGIYMETRTPKNSEFSRRNYRVFVHSAR